MQSWSARKTFQHSSAVIGNIIGGTGGDASGGAGPDQDQAGDDSHF